LQRAGRFLTDITQKTSEIAGLIPWNIASKTGWRGAAFAFIIVIAIVVQISIVPIVISIFGFIYLPPAG